MIVEYPETKLVSTNVIIHAGGRYERPEQYGLSHFLEHVAFKGTKSYPKPGETTELIENLGGIVNAWTSEQATCYWNILPSEHFDIALKILSEQVSALKLPPKEINKERGPIIEEIKRAHDDPYAFVWNKIYDIMWPNQPISNGILGPEENIRNFQAKDFAAYQKERYVGRNITICIASSLKPELATKSVRKYFEKVKKGTTKNPVPVFSEQTSSQLCVTYRDIKQAHILFGYKAFGLNDPRVPALKVLMNILTSGMSSLLFKEVREKRSAAYAVQGDTEFFSDAGATLIYAGLNTEKTEEVITAIKGILNDLKTKKLTDDAIEKAKEFIKGINLYRLDGVERTAYWYTTRGLLDPANLDPGAYLESINKVTAEDVLRVAQDVFKTENESLLILGPFKDSKKFAKILAE